MRMLKRLAVFSFLLLALAVQAYPQPHKAQKGTDGHKPTDSASSAPAQQTGSPRFQTEQEKHVNADVRVIETPPKDRYDKTLFWVNLVLAVVGVLGIGIGICTLLFIRAQVVEMRHQRAIMRRTLNTMRRQADTMDEQAEDARNAAKESALTTGATLETLRRQAEMIEAQNRTARERERARIVIRELWPPLLATKSEEVKPDVPLKISMMVVNDGLSAAYNVRAEGSTFFLEGPIVHDGAIDADYDPADWYKLLIPKTLYPKSDHVHAIEVFVTHMAAVHDELYQPVDTSLVEAMISGAAFVAVAGEITYEDIFGETHETPFHLVWMAGKGEAGMGVRKEHSGWIDLSRKAT